MKRITYGLAGLGAGFVVLIICNIFDVSESTTWYWVGSFTQAFYWALLYYNSKPEFKQQKTAINKQL